MSLETPAAGTQILEGSEESFETTFKFFEKRPLRSADVQPRVRTWGKPSELDPSIAREDLLALGMENDQPLIDAIIVVLGHRLGKQPIEGLDDALNEASNEAKRTGGDQKAIRKAMRISGANFLFDLLQTDDEFETLRENYPEPLIRQLSRNFMPEDSVHDSWREFSVSTFVNYVQLRDRFSDLPQIQAYALAHAMADLPGEIWSYSDKLLIDWGGVGHRAFPETDASELVEYFFEEKSITLSSQIGTWWLTESSGATLENGVLGFSLASLDFSSAHIKKSGSSVTSELSGFVYYRDENGVCATPVSGVQENGILILDGALPQLEAELVTRLLEGTHTDLELAELSKTLLSDPSYQPSAADSSRIEFKLKSDNGPAKQIELAASALTDFSCIRMSKSERPNIKPYWNNVSGFQLGSGISISELANAQSHNRVLRLQLEDHQQNLWQAALYSANNVFRAQESSECSIPEEKIHSLAGKSKAEAMAVVNTKVYPENAALWGLISTDSESFLFWNFYRGSERFIAKPSRW